MNHLLAARQDLSGETIEGLGPLGGEGTNLFLTPTDTLTMFAKVISNLIGFLTVIAGIYFAFQFIFGAYEWITSGGDSQKIQKAQQKMLNGVIGLIIVIAAVFFIDLIGALLGLDILNPIPTIRGLW